MPKLSIPFPPSAKPATAKRTWNRYHNDIFAWVANGSGNAIVQAVAGGTKSSTIKECVRRIRGSSIFLAFNKAIATELKNDGVNARTFHSLCFGPVLGTLRIRDPEPNKLRMLTELKMTEEEQVRYGYFACRLVGLARQQGFGIPHMQPAEDRNAWITLAEHHDLELDHPEADFDTAIGFAQALLGWSNDACQATTGSDGSRISGLVDFDDMLYQAIRLPIVLPKYDWIFVDEAQDTNAIQREILRKLFRRSGTTRMIAVGDSAQAIYGFRGSDSDSMQLMQTDFNCKPLPLSISYRCARSIVQYAKTWCPQIEARPDAPEGEVLQLGPNWLPSIFQPEDLVVCRTTRPLISLAYRMLRERIPVCIAGRDIGEGLKTLIKKMRARGIEHLASKLSTWADREAQRALEKKQDGKAESIRDKAASLLCLIDALPENDRTVPALIRVIDQLFDPGVGKTLLSTIHKAKGLEAEAVYWLNPGSSCRARQDWQQREESNLCNVAATRAKTRLVLIEEPKK